MNWFYLIGALLSFLAAWSFLIFLRGFLSGISYVFSDNGNADHMGHYSVRTVWGFLLLIPIFVIWEVLRGVATWFGYGNANTTTTWVMIVLGVIVAIFISKQSGGGGH
jgi:hypothetical protein